MNDEQLVIPRFKNWTKPANVLEVLERCLDHARIEQKWSSNEWFVTNGAPNIEYEWETNWVTPESHAEVTKWIEGQTCTDIKACAAGIIAIETLDGAALYAYLKSEELDEHFLKQDPLAWGAVERVAVAFAEEFAQEEAVHDRPGKYDSDPLGRIIHHNDAGYLQRRNVNLDGHHDRIVRCFERAVELERTQA